MVASLASIPYHFWRPTGPSLLRRMGTASILGCVGGGAFLAMGVYRKLQADSAADAAWGAYDRAFRLRYNKGQVSTHSTANGWLSKSTHSQPPKVDWRRTQLLAFTTHTHVQRLWDRLAYSSASVGLFLGAVVFAGGLFGAAAGFSSGLSLGVVEFAAVKVTALRAYLPAAFKEEEDDEDATADGAAAAKKAD